MERNSYDWMWLRQKVSCKVSERLLSLSLSIYICIYKQYSASLINNNMKLSAFCVLSHNLYQHFVLISNQYRGNKFSGPENLCSPIFRLQILKHQFWGKFKNFLQPPNPPPTNHHVLWSTQFSSVLSSFFLKRPLLLLNWQEFSLLVNKIWCLDILSY